MLIANKIDKTVVRNQAYTGGEFDTRERHNERKNESYGNGDIDPARADMNVHFRRVLSPAGTSETYEQTFNRLLSDGTIVKHGLKPDAKVFDEMIFDVDSAYFENHGGYDYAKTFFEEAYRIAIEEVGGEQFILSAVMHADERNKALSEELGRDVYHYHIHVVYIPIVRKELYFKKNNKDPALAGKLKEVINQISHSKKWPMKMPVEKNGKTIMVNSYSLLQDRFYEHMRAAGFEGFERGERGSTAEHLSNLEYKTNQENERLTEATAEVKQKQDDAAELDWTIAGKQQTAADLDERAEKKKKRIEKLDETISVKTKAAATVAEVDAIGRPALLGGFSVTADEMGKLKTLAKKSVTADEKVATATRRLRDAEDELSEVKTKLAAELKKRPSLKENLSWFDKFVAAMRRAPKRLMAVIEDILRQPPEKQEPEHSQQHRKSIGER